MVPLGMIGRRWIARSMAGRVLLRSLAVLALAAQASALAAPLIDIPTHPHQHAITIDHTGGPDLDRSGTPDHQHDPATCPSCIAQSIVAVVSPPPARLAASPRTARLVLRDQQVTLRHGSPLLIRTRGPPALS